MRRVLKLSSQLARCESKRFTAATCCFFLLHFSVNSPCNRLRFLWTARKMVPESKIFPSSGWLNEAVARLTESTPAFSHPLLPLSPILRILFRFSFSSVEYSNQGAAALLVNFAFSPLEIAELRRGKNPGERKSTPPQHREITDDVSYFLRFTRLTMEIWDWGNLMFITFRTRKLIKRSPRVLYVPRSSRSHFTVWTTDFTNVRGPNRYHESPCESLDASPLLAVAWIQMHKLFW